MGSRHVRRLEAHSKAHAMYSLRCGAFVQSFAQSRCTSYTVCVFMCVGVLQDEVEAAINRTAVELYSALDAALDSKA